MKMKIRKLRRAAMFVVYTTIQTATLACPQLLVPKLSVIVHPTENK